MFETGRIALILPFCFAISTLAAAQSSPGGSISASVGMAALAAAPKLETPLFKTPPTRRHIMVQKFRREQDEGGNIRTFRMPDIDAKILITPGDTTVDARIRIYGVGSPSPDE